MSKNFVPGSGLMDKGFTDVFIKKGTTVLTEPASVAAAEADLYGTAAVFTAQIDTAFVTADDGQYFSFNTPSYEYVVWWDLDNLGTEAATVKAANTGANIKFVRVGYANGEVAATQAAALKNALNANNFSKQEIVATVLTDTVTITVNYGGATDGVDAGTAVGTTVAEDTAGVGTWTLLTQTAEGQSISSEDGTTVNSGQGETITLSDILTFGCNAMNYSGDNYTYCLNTFNRQKCQVVLYANDSFKKTYETATATINVKKITVDGSRQEIQFSFSLDSSDALSKNPVWDLNVDGE